MFTKFRVKNAETPDYYDFNVAFGASPATKIDITVDQRNADHREKMEAHGLWPTFTYRGGATIDVEGDLFKTTTALYVIERKAILAALFATPDTIKTKRYDVTVIFRLDGEAEDWQTNCEIMAWSAPVEALYPAKTTYLLTLMSFDPWFIGSASGKKYWWA